MSKVQLTREQYDEISSLLAEGFHTAFRKASSHPKAHEAWSAIRNLPSSEWNSVIEFVMWGTFGRRPSAPKKK